MQPWQFDHQVSAIRRLWQECFFFFFFFEKLLGFRICFVKPILVFPGRQVNNFSRVFLLYGLHLLPLFTQ